MWWMWHDNVGHWVINKTPNSHGGDLFKSVLALDECPGDVAAWTGTGRVKHFNKRKIYSGNKIWKFFRFLLKILIFD